MEIYIAINVLTLNKHLFFALRRNLDQNLFLNIFTTIFLTFLSIFTKKQPTLPIHDDIHGMLVSGMQPSLSDPPSDDMHHPMDHPDGPDGKSQTNFLNIYFLIFSLLLCI